MKILNKTILFLFTILSVNVLIGQSKDFPTTEATWTYNLLDGPPTTSNITYFLSGDTIINGLTYQSVNNGLDGFFRTEDEKIYHLPSVSAQEHLTYDFALVEGDTFINHFGVNGIDTLVVDNVDSIMINDVYRKTWGFHNNPGWWIEGIGGVFSLFYPNYDHGGFIGEKLLCFKQEDDWIYQDTVYVNSYYDVLEVSCEGVIVSTESPQQIANQIKISPNPFTDQFKILSPEIPKGTVVQIYSLLGELIQTISYQNQIMLPELPSGTYLLSLKIEQQEFISLLQKL